MTQSLRIAVADDEPIVRDYFRRMLPRMGHEVVAAASNGSELVELCVQCDPDLIIADVRMPDLDGDEAIQKICSVRFVPFILISAYSKPPEMIADFGAGQWTYLTKPVKREDLEAAIARICPTRDE